MRDVPTDSPSQFSSRLAAKCKKQNRGTRSSYVRITKCFFSPSLSLSPRDNMHRPEFAPRRFPRGGCRSREAKGLASSQHARVDEQASERTFARHVGPPLRKRQEPATVYCPSIIGPSLTCATHSLARRRAEKRLRLKHALRTLHFTRQADRASSSTPSIPSSSARFFSRSVIARSIKSKGDRRRHRRAVGDD